MPIATFDGDNKLINITDEEPEVNVQDLYSEWKDWARAQDNLKFEPAFRIVGGDPLPGEKKLGITYFLNSNWKIRPNESNHSLNINGNLYSEDGANPFIPTIGQFNVQIIQQVSSLVDSTVQQLEEIEYSSYQNKVWINTASTFSGIDYPTGTPRAPVSNLADAKLIADERGLTELRNISGVLPISASESIASYKITGTSPTVSIILTEFGSDTTLAEFIDLSCSGFYNNSTFNECFIDDIYLLKGYVVDSFLGETINILPGQITFLHSCLSQHPMPSSSTINLDNGGIAIMTAIEGRIAIENNTLVPAQTQITLNHGTVLVDSTNFVGIISVDGDGTVVDFNTGEYLKSGIYGNLQLINNTLSFENITEKVMEEDLSNRNTPNTLGWFAKKYLTLKQFMSLG